MIAKDDDMGEISSMYDTICLRFLVTLQLLSMNWLGFHNKTRNFDNMKDFAAIDFETANSERSSVCSAFQMYQMDYPDYQFFCTCRASRNKLGSRLPNHQLQTVAAYCGYDLTQHHNALADAEACAWIARELLWYNTFKILFQYSFSVPPTAYWSILC